MWAVRKVEPGGSNEPIWLRDGVSDRRMFKQVVMRDGRRQGEDWAEKIAAELAHLVGVPAPGVELAIRDGHPGCICDDLVPGADWEMQTGSVLIGAIDPAFVPKAKNRVGHNLINIEAILRPLPPLPGLDPELSSSYDVFCGYLMLDAWIANADRHDANWSVYRNPGDELFLSPSYDHGNSLGFNLIDDRRQTELSRGIASWAAKGCAIRFENSRKVTLVELTQQALSRTTAGVRDYWMSRLGEVTVGQWEQIVGLTPGMSPAARIFCTELLKTNQRRLLTHDY